MPWLRTSRLWMSLHTARCSKDFFVARSYSRQPFKTAPGSLSPLKYTKRIAIGTLKVINFLFAVHLFTTYVGRVSFMAGPSMLPTLAVGGELVIEDLITYRLFPSKMARGDLLIVKSPIEPKKMVCKRLIGLPGDIVCVDPTGQIFPSTEHIVVPKGHIWISGDNAAASRDSRMYGPVPIGLVKGRAFARIWPLKSFKIFTNQITYIK
ncbi:hypothetical protein CVT25_012335 [Psilocybe cyanescens]|uniref:Peptidase S26 domain-containing protein n=1 Tax=Psilocybe cyanescens TaxID=93625 RepID=A0A409XFR7_PSICY|nr:hypothetical protein CVT25_012335 [Psilocybe cyanescens]